MRHAKLLCALLLFTEAVGFGLLMASLFFSTEPMTRLACTIAGVVTMVLSAAAAIWTFYDIDGQQWLTNAEENASLVDDTM